MPRSPRRPKSLPESSITGQKGINIIERIVLDMGCLWIPRTQFDAGIDGYIELRDEGTGTVAEVRHILQKNGGNLGTSGSVAWQFDRKGQIFVDVAKHTEEEVFEAVLEAGAEDVVVNGDAVDWLRRQAAAHPRAVAGVPLAIREVEATLQLAQVNINPQLALAGLLRRIHEHVA